MRQRLKRLSEKLLLNAGPAMIGRRLRRSGVLVLAYHNILPPGSSPGADRSLHLPFTDFVAQLDILQGECRVVSLSDLIDASGGPGQPLVAITFDDAYAGAVQVGLSELHKRGLPATMFVAPAFLEGKSFWWDCITSGQTPELPEAVRRHALESLRGDDALIRSWAVSAGLEVTEPSDAARCADLAALRRAAALPGMTMASHTWSHPNLTALSARDLRSELERSRQWLDANFSAPGNYLSFPYGLTNAAVEQAAHEAGYSAAFRVTGGWMTNPGPRRLSLSRFNVPAGISLDGFRLRLAGLLCR